MSQSIPTYDFPAAAGGLYKALIVALTAAGIETPDLEARLILQERAQIGWGDLIARPNLEVGATALSLITGDVKARTAGKPLSRIYGRREFWGLPFTVTDDVLDPRPDTETIIDLAIRRMPDRAQTLRILDLGTGSGCILTALLHEYPNAQGVGADISPAALALAEKNAAANGVAARASFRRSDWFAAIEAGEMFDLIVSNPPYIRESVIPALSPEVRNFDPILALDGGADGLEPYKKIFAKLFCHLKPHGLALFEIGFDQREDIMRLGRESRFEEVNVHPDLAGQPRVAEIRRGDK